MALYCPFGIALQCTDTPTIRHIQVQTTVELVSDERPLKNEDNPET